MSSKRPTLSASPRTDFGSRTSRRLRRDGRIPGVVYSKGEETVAFQVESREARNILHEGHALFDLEIEGSKAVPVVVKEQQHHPVRGDLSHLDLQQVDLNQAIQAEVAVELTGEDVAPGVKQGGVLEHVTREVTVEALPTDIPDLLSLDVSAMEILDVLTLEDLSAPEGVALIADDPSEITLVTLTPPRVEEEPEAEEPEAEPEVVGEDEAGEEPAEESSDEE
ncbi:MAG: 50S ribosomal protein L25 [Solirubrobacterales bacterium]|nr:50S ribosomal protein L25 [Solirubrobacterales bacterium]